MKSFINIILFFLSLSTNSIVVMSLVSQYGFIIKKGSYNIISKEFNAEFLLWLLFITITYSSCLIGEKIFGFKPKISSNESKPYNKYEYMNETNLTARMNECLNTEDYRELQIIKEVLDRKFPN